LIYQTPNTNTSTKQYSTSASYYATTTIGGGTVTKYHQNGGDYFDGTKSLPHKKKRKYHLLLFHSK